MLTKDLVRYRVYKGAVKPKFIDPSDHDLLAQAAAMIEVFVQGCGLSRGELEQETDRLVESSPTEAVVSRGLEKLLTDRSEFDVPADDERPDFREKVFRTAGAFLRDAGYDNPEDYLQATESALGQPIAQIRSALFNDLPMHHPMIKFKKITAEKLLHLYNCAQVQWLLLHCEELEVTLRKTAPARLRQLFKYLRFQQLLAEVHREKKGLTGLRISGPLSMFYQTRKYGMKLAFFFPALLHQPDWQLHARIEPKKGRKLTLSLDQSCGILPQQSRFLAYIPLEVQSLSESLTRHLPEWKLEPAADFVQLSGEVYCFPDFTLQDDKDNKVSIELFHAWHASHLLVRLAQMEEPGKTRLLLGVSRKLLKDPATQSALEGSAYFARRGFTFSEIPSGKQVANLLKNLDK